MIGGVIANDNQMFDRMAEESRRYAARFSRHSINLLETSAALRARFGDNTQLNSLDTEAHALSTLSVSNALLSERLVIALGLLSHFDHEVTPANDAEVSERESRFFSRDEDLFAAPAVASPVSDTDRKRISITRHKTSEDIAIPLVEETLTPEA